MKKKILSVIKYLLSLALGAGLFWLAIKDAPFSQIVDEFKKVNYSWIAFTTVIMLLSHVVRAIRWNQLLVSLGPKPALIHTTYAVLIGYFANLAVPRLGEVTRCSVLAKHEKLPVNSVIGTVIAERAYDLVCLLIIILVTVFSQISFLSESKLMHDVAAKIAGKGAILIIVAAVLIVFMGLCFILIKYYRSKLRKYKIYCSIEKLIKGFWEGVKTIKNVKNKKMFILNTVIIWTLYTSTLYFSFFAFGETDHLTFVDALTINVMGSIGVVAPTQGGMGAYQYIVKVTLVSLFLIPEVTAISYANIVYFNQWIMTIIFGSISWILLFLSTKKINKNEQN